MTPSTPSPRALSRPPRDAVQRDKRHRREAAAKKRRGPVRMVGYVRVSTEDQGDLGVGLEAQREAIRSACTVARGSS